MKEGLFHSKSRRAGGWLAVVCLTALAWQGCGDDDGKPSGQETPAGVIRILEPQAGQVVKTHSLRFAVSLDPELNPAGLRALLNGEDVSAHLRARGAQAEGCVSGMTEGQNVLRFTAGWGERSRARSLDHGSCERESGTPLWRPDPPLAG